jgi:hypothetical protein
MWVYFKVKQSTWVGLYNKYDNMHSATVKQGEYNKQGKYEKLINGDIKFMELS